MTQKLAKDVKLPSFHGKHHQHELTITEIPKEGIVITRPGTYVFKGDLTWTPNEEEDEEEDDPHVHAAIAITCSNVVLDFKGFALQCSAKDSSTMHCIGVAVLPLDNATDVLQKIEIRSGKVENFHTYGVLVAAAEDITLNDLTVAKLRNADQHHGSVGILVAACHGVKITGGGCESSKVESNAHSAIQLRFCENVSVKDVSVNNEHNKSGGNVGLAIVGCRDVHAEDVKVTDLTVGTDLAPESPGNTCLGVFIYLSTAVSLHSASITKVHGSCDDSHGISVFVCPQNIAVSNCTVKDVKTGFNTAYNSGAKATGVEIMVATDVAVSNCIVTDVSASIPQDRQVAGFSSGFTWRVRFNGCKANNIKIVLPEHTSNEVKGFYTAAGFGWAPDPRKVFIRPSIDARFKNCEVKDADVAFDDFMHHHAKFKTCTYTSCNHALGNPLANEARVVACDKCSECVPPATRVVENERVGTRGIPTPKIIE